MAVVIVLVTLTLAAGLIYAGSVEIERRAERCVRYERWMHPPDDNGDGVTLLEVKDDADH